MSVLMFLFVILFAYGLFMLLAGILKLPTVKTTKAMLNTGKKEKKLAKTMDALYLDGAVKLSRFIRINDYRRSRMLCCGQAFL